MRRILQKLTNHNNDNSDYKNEQKNKLKLNKKLLSAAKNCDPDQIKFCLEIGADANAKAKTSKGLQATSKDGSTALMIVISALKFGLIDKNGHQKCINLLLEAGADINSIKNKYGLTALDIATEQVTDLKKFLNERPRANDIKSNLDSLQHREELVEFLKQAEKALSLKKDSKVEKLNIETEKEPSHQESLFKFFDESFIDNTERKNIEDTVRNTEPIKFNQEINLSGNKLG